MSWSETIQKRAGKKILDRGLKYYQEGRVRKTVRRGNDMEARVSGSQPEPYHVRISLDENEEMVNAYCD